MYNSCEYSANLWLPPESQLRPKKEENRLLALLKNNTWLCQDLLNSCSLRGGMQQRSILSTNINPINSFSLQSCDCLLGQQGVNPQAFAVFGFSCFLFRENRRKGGDGVNHEFSRSGLQVTLCQPSAECKIPSEKKSRVAFNEFNFLTRKAL